MFMPHLHNCCICTHKDAVSILPPCRPSQLVTWQAQCNPDTYLPSHMVMLSSWGCKQGNAVKQLTVYNIRLGLCRVSKSILGNSWKTGGGDRRAGDRRELSKDVLSHQSQRSGPLTPPLPVRLLPPTKILFLKFPASYHFSPSSLPTSYPLWASVYRCSAQNTNPLI